MNSKSGHNSESIYAANFEPYPNNITTRATSQNSTSLNTALNHYDANDYELALKEFEAIASQSDTVAFYTGITQLALGNFQSAEEKFEQVKKQSQSIYNVQAQWYLGLTLLRLDKNIKAKRTFQKLKQENPNSIYANKANQILKEVLNE